MKGRKLTDEYIKRSIIRICKFIHIILTIAVYSVFLHYYNDHYNENGVGHTRFILFVLLYSIVLLFSLRTYKSYDFGLSESSMLVYSQTLADIIAGGVFYVVFVIANSELFTPVPLIMMIILQVILNIVLSVAINKLYFKINKPKKTVLIYDNEASIRRIGDAYSRKKNFNVVKEIKADENDTGWLAEIEDCEAVFVAGLSQKTRDIILKICIEKSKECYTAPYIDDIIMKGAKHMYMFSVPVFEISRAELKIEYALIKRIFDIFCAALGIVLLSPLMALIAIAIKVGDGGPVLYKQVRLTTNGKHFKIYKFRSMTVNAESDGVARLAGENDSRITPVGKLIRACRLDELPQLFNILKGDMAIVGPRPERPEIAAQYEEVLPEFNLRLQVKAGLTGFAQIYGRYNTEPYDKLQMDLMYINEMSFITDLRLVFATIKILFIKESTQGTADGQTTALANSEEREVTLK